MLEYLYNAIVATSGEDICICAKVKDDSGNIFKDGCYLCIYDDKELVIHTNGSLEQDTYNFTVPGDKTANLKGRYWYAICDLNHKSMDFKQPIYFK